MSPTYSQKSWSLNALYPSHNGSEINAAFAELEGKIAPVLNKIATSCGRMPLCFLIVQI